MEAEHNTQPAHRDQMGRHRIIRKLLLRVPYRLGLVMLTWVWRLPGCGRLQQRWCRPLISLNRYLDGAQLKVDDFRVFVQVNFLAHWRLNALCGASDDVFNRYVRFINLQYLDRFAGKRPIILCNSHFGGGKLAGPLLARKGYSLLTLDRINSYSFGDRVTWAGRLECLKMGLRHEQQFLLKALFKCQKALRKKKIVQIVADGYRGSSSVTVNFLGKQRAFRSSFAELAVASNAVVIPTLCVVNAKGEVAVEFSPPVDSQAVSGSDSEKVQKLCQDYARWLSNAWLREPASVFKNDIKLFLSLPSAKASVDTDYHLPT